MLSLNLHSILSFLIDLPENIVRLLSKLIKDGLSGGGKQKEKIRTLSLTANLIESSQKGIKIFSVEVLEDFSVFRGLYPRQISQAMLERFRKTITSTLGDKNVFVSQDNTDPRVLKVVVQN